MHVSNDVRRCHARQRRLYRDAAVVDPSSSATRPLVSTETRDPHTAQGAVELVPGWLTGGRAAQALAEPGTPAAAEVGGLAAAAVLPHRAWFPLTNPVVRSRPRTQVAEQQGCDLRKVVRRVGVEPTTRWLGVA